MPAQGQKSWDKQARYASHDDIDESQCLPRGRNPGTEENMKISSLFTVMTDANDILDFFENVNTTDQLVSRLERLKQQPGRTNLLACIDSLRASISELLDDTLEVSTFGGEAEENPMDDMALDAELDSLVADTMPPGQSPEASPPIPDPPPPVSAEKQISEAPTPAEDGKTNGA